MSQAGRPDQGDDPGDETPGPAVRAPQSMVESIIAHCRPQPAIPAVLVFVISILIPVMSFDPNAAASAWQLLIPAGILVSCGLAIAAGFCSLFPQLIWIVLASWALKFTQSGPLPAYNRFVLLAGIGAAAIMVGVQAWRAATGRFRPTIRVDRDDPDDRD